VRERRTTVIFTTHDVSEAEHHADRVLVLADGTTRFEGTPAELHAAAGDDGDDFERAFVRFLERTDAAA
jgi:ABC-2 type transport system ATP-binding protein